MPYYGQPTRPQQNGYNFGNPYAQFGKVGPGAPGQGPVQAPPGPQPNFSPPAAAQGAGYYGAPGYDWSGGAHFVNGQGWMPGGTADQQGGNFGNVNAPSAGPNPSQPGQPYPPGTPGPGIGTPEGPGEGTGEGGITTNPPGSPLSPGSGNVEDPTWDPNKPHGDWNSPPGFGRPPQYAPLPGTPGTMPPGTAPGFQPGPPQPVTPAIPGMGGGTFPAAGTPGTQNPQYPWNNPFGPATGAGTGPNGAPGPGQPGGPPAVGGGGLPGVGGGLPAGAGAGVPGGAGTPAAPGTPAAGTPANPALGTFLNNLFGDYQHNYANALANNQALYHGVVANYQGTGQRQVAAENNIINNYGQWANAEQNYLNPMNSALGQQQAAQKGITAGYGNLSNQVLGDIQGIDKSQRQQIEDTYAQQAGATDQSAVSRGLANTTIRDSLQRGNTLDREKAHIALSNQMAGLTAGYRSNLGLAGLGYQGQASQQDTAQQNAIAQARAGYNLQAGMAGLGYMNQANQQNTALDLSQYGFQAATQIPYPQLGAYTSLAQMAGQVYGGRPA